MENTQTKWEIKDRLYKLKGTKQPLTYRISSKHSSQSPLLYFDQDKGVQRELRYATNMPSPFVDEQNGAATLGHIVFKSGNLLVTKQQQNLQKLLSLYHPKRDQIYFEVKPEENAIQDVDYLETEIDALNIAKDLEIDHAEAILRVEIGSRVNKMSSKEIKRDILLMARKNPFAFLELVSDENVTLRNFGIRATEEGFIKLSSDQRTFTWGNTGRKLMTVPFDENPYSALAAWFKTDEGLDVYRSLEKKLK
tara:strand:- start:20547 stop:21299 length:753 start_codon:yes stop_codon:yes gene_type:complete